ncbi:MAG: N-acetyltransferase [candidate division FCPU426 bacterium]
MIRKATLQDVPAIHRLINSRAKQGQMLARSLSEIYENIRDYFVAIERKAVVGVAGLHVNWADLAEIKSVAVNPAYQGKGVGQALVQACLEESRVMAIPKVFVLTYVPGFFRKQGFKKIKREALPHKIWSDCIKCPHFPNCNEEAMIIGLRR